MIDRDEHWFAERRETSWVYRSAAGHEELELDRDAGVSRTVQEGSRTEHRSAFLDGLQDDPMPGVPEALREPLTAFAQPWPRDSESVARLRDARDDALAKCRDLGLPGVDVSVRARAQEVAALDRAGLREDRRGYATLALQVPRSARGGPLRREAAFDSLDELEAGTGALCERLAEAVEDARAAGAPEALEPGPQPVVLGPGHCAMFFHEVCGHPLEADIVASGTSYLGWRLGRSVAPEFLTVVDDPTAPRAFAGYAVDDEGIPAAPAPLVEGGRVAAPLLDRAHAAAWGREGNGHGRRLAFHYPALPRQCHTRVMPHAGSAAEIVGDVGRGVFVQRLRLRHMDIATGTFSFYIAEGRHIVDGRLGRPVSGGVLRGDGLAALASIDAVGDDSRTFMTAGGGCGKLDQGALLVSFEQPSVRLRSLDITDEHVAMEE